MPSNDTPSWLPSAHQGELYASESLALSDLSDKKQAPRGQNPSSNQMAQRSPLFRHSFSFEPKGCHWVSHKQYLDHRKDARLGLAAALAMEQQQLCNTCLLFRPKQQSSKASPSLSSPTTSSSSTSMTTSSTSTPMTTPTTTSPSASPASTTVILALDL